MLAQIWSLTRKELSLWLKRPGQWIVVFVVPFIFIWIFNVVFGGSSGAPIVSVYLVNEDGGAAAQTAVTALGNAANLQIEMLADRAEADRRVGAGQRLAAIIIPAGFSEAIQSTQGGKIEIIADPARSEQAAIVGGLVNAALGPMIIDAEVSRGINQQIGDSLNSLSLPGSSADDNAKLKEFLSAAFKGVVSAQVQDAIDHPLVQIEEVSAVNASAAHPLTLVEGLVPGYSLMYVFFLISMIANTVVEERETGSLRRLQVLPARRGTILLGKALPFFLIAVVQMGALLIVSHYVFKMGLGQHPAALLPVILGTSVSVAGLGIMIAALVRSGGQASGLTILVVLIMAAASGSLFPAIRIPFVEYLTPHHWAILGIQNVIARGMDWSGVLLPSAVLLAAGAAFFTIGVMRFKFD